MTALPAWIDAEAWDGFLAMRKAMKKPTTPRAEMLVLKTLYQMKEMGHDPNASLDQSTVRNWIDVFEPKAKEMTNLVKTYYEPEPPRTPEQMAADIAARDAVMSKLKLKLVA